MSAGAEIDRKCKIARRRWIQNTISVRFMTEITNVDNDVTKKLLVNDDNVLEKLSDNWQQLSIRKWKNTPTQKITFIISSQKNDPKIILGGLNDRIGCEKVSMVQYVWQD